MNPKEINPEILNTASQEKIIDDQYLRVKNDLLSGALSVYDFRDKLLELDQSDISRIKSINNL